MAAATIAPASALRSREVRLRWRTVPLGGVLQRTALLADLEDAWIRARAGEDGYPRR